MPEDFFKHIIDKIHNANPIHAKKIKKNRSTCLLGIKEAERFFNHFFNHSNTQTDIDYIVDCYNRMIKDMLYYRQRFLSEGVYANRSLADVEKQVYHNPAIMDYHMHGLLLAQFLWPDQYHRLCFFRNHLKSFESAHTYLEVGAGHGIYVREVLQNLPGLSEADVLDISETSLKICKALVQSPVVNFIQRNILEYDKDRLYDLISIAEVIEHLENPAAVLQKIKRLLSKDGIVFLSTPVNSPMVDHIYLFTSIEEIKELLFACDFYIIEETFMSSEPLNYTDSLKMKVPIMYAAFLKAKN